jgi:hypothetical protein
MIKSQDSEIVTSRKIVVRGWNTAQTAPSINGYNRVITPYRAIYGNGDYLARKDYVCGGSNPTNASRPGRKVSIGSIISHCDTTGVEGNSGNPRFVADSSDYTRYKALTSHNATY